jgi:hypothetical protein
VSVVPQSMQPSGHCMSSHLTQANTVYAGVLLITVKACLRRLLCVFEGVPLRYAPLRPLPEKCNRADRTQSLCQYLYIPSCLPTRPLHKQPHVALATIYPQCVCRHCMSQQCHDALRRQSVALPRRTTYQTLCVVLPSPLSHHAASVMPALSALAVPLTSCSICDACTLCTGSPSHIMQHL